MESLTWTIQQFFDRVARGDKNFADLIDDFREYQKALKMDEFRSALPDSVEELKSKCTLIKFNCLKEAAWGPRLEYK